MLQKKLLLAFVLSLGVSAVALAQVNCSNAKNKNQDECVRAKVNNNSNNNINCSDVKNKNQDECVRAKANNNGNMNNVDCRNANDADVRQACRKAKY